LFAPARRRRYWSVVPAGPDYDEGLISAFYQKRYAATAAIEQRAILARIGGQFVYPHSDGLSGARVANLLQAAKSLFRKAGS
jgi:hypothetical protein